MPATGSDAGSNGQVKVSRPGRPGDTSAGCLGDSTGLQEFKIDALATKGINLGLMVKRLHDLLYHRLHH